jgi:GST-like protein
MIDLYTVATPNGHKVSIMLEECGLKYNVLPQSIRDGDQFRPDFLKLNPNGKFPALVDHDPIGGGAPITVFESGAMLIYLADKTQRFLPREPRKYYDVMQWLMWQMAGFGPMHGQAHHFIRYAPEHHEYPTKRYMGQALRIMNVLDGHLKDRDYVAAGEYTIADMAIWPWVRSIRIIELEMSDWPHIRRWFDRIYQRPAVAIGKQVINEKVYHSPPADRQRLPPEWWSNMFGENQHKRRA